MLGAFNQQAEDSHPSQQEELQDFDELMRSGETMKVSLTPNRLKAYDVSFHQDTTLIHSGCAGCIIQKASRR